MPGGDRTGPFGEGALTGRRMGYCLGNDHSVSGNFDFSRGRGFGRGFRGGFSHGRRVGFRHGNYYNEPAPTVTEKTLIENEIRILKDQLTSLEKNFLKQEENEARK